MTAKVTPNNKNVEEILSLTPLQEGLFFHYLNKPSGNLYFEQLCLHLSGFINIKCFNKAWEMVRDPNSQRVRININPNSVFDIPYIRKLFYFYFNQWVQEANRNTGLFLP